MKICHHVQTTNNLRDFCCASFNTRSIFIVDLQKDGWHSFWLFGYNILYDSISCLSVLITDDAIDLKDYHRMMSILKTLSKILSQVNW